jgi:hypothetical protein
VYNGEKTLRNLEDRFYFSGLPLEVGSMKSEKAQVEWLADCVCDLLQREEQQLRALALARQNEQLKKAPALNPAKNYGQSNFDHYANQREVLLKLLRKKWPQLSKAIDERGAEQTEHGKQERQKAVWLAYIADYKVLFGEPPDVKKEEAAELWRQDDFIRLMSEALKARLPRIDQRDWQLAIGWIEKNYYRMNERELEAAFARDWNYKPGLLKGHTLAVRAHRLNLVTYLLPGPHK